MNKRNPLRLTGTLLGLFWTVLSPVASAQTSYPNKPIRLIITNPAGGLPDTVAVAKAIAAAQIKPE